jgi:hypothetical protein
MRFRGHTKSHGVIPAQAGIHNPSVNAHPQTQYGSPIKSGMTNCCVDRSIGDA